MSCSLNKVPERFTSSSDSSPTPPPKHLVLYQRKRLSQRKGSSDLLSNQENIQCQNPTNEALLLSRKRRQELISRHRQIHSQMATPDFACQALDLNSWFQPQDANFLEEDSDSLEDDLIKESSQCNGLPDESEAIQDDLEVLSLTDQSQKSTMPSATSFTSELEESDSLISVSPIFPSCFANVPPTIYFASSKEKVRALPVTIRRHLKWKLSSITPLLVRQTVLRSGFRIVRDNSENQEEIIDWAGTWGKHMKSSAFRLVQDYQKVNHFPGSFHFGRKDKLWQNVSRMAAKFGRAFNFIPETYILPQDAKNLKNAWDRSGSKKNWIIKPPASARGTGIHVIHKWSQIPKKQPVVVQRYLSAPFLINDTKFDLRLYVLLTSFDPLRIYVYDDGLVRFASVKYSKAQHSLGDRFMHLTNYSINKRSASYTSNEDETICQGHKWSLKALWGYLEKQGIDTKALWSSLIDIIIKTILSCECHVWRLVKYNTKSRYSCFELFGFDILLDKNLRPWLLEVNISPSLHSNSLLDTNIKGNLVKDMLNIAGYQVPNKIGSHSLQASLLKRFGISTAQTKSLCMNRVLHRWRKTAKEKQKHLRYEKQDATTLPNILEELTPDDVRILMEGEDEYQRRGSFIRVFPTLCSHSYHQYFDCLHYYNHLLDAWEHRVNGDRMVALKYLQEFAKSEYHLQVPPKDTTSSKATRGFLLSRSSFEAKRVSSPDKPPDPLAGGDAKLTTALSAFRKEPPPSHRYIVPQGYYQNLVRQSRAAIYTRVATPSYPALAIVNGDWVTLPPPISNWS